MAWAPYPRSASFDTDMFTFYHRSKGKIFAAKNGTFLEKEFFLERSEWEESRT